MTQSEGKRIRHRPQLLGTQFCIKLSQAFGLPLRND